MTVFCKTREQARKLANARKANGYPAKLVDNGKEAAKRFGVSLRG